MALISFQKNAGEKLFQGAEAQPESAGESPSTEQRQQQERDSEQAILSYISSQDLAAEGLAVKFDSASATVTVTGKSPDQQTREKIILCSGNVEGVGRVDDQLEIAQWGDSDSDWYTVKQGDTLSGIAQHFFSNAQKYWDIFEANQPMMAHPDKIYPGQMMRIPPAPRRCYEPTILWRKNRNRSS